MTKVDDPRNLGDRNRMSYSAPPTLLAFQEIRRSTQHLKTLTELLHSEVAIYCFRIESNCYGFQQDECYKRIVDLQAQINIVTGSITDILRGTE